MNALVGMSVIAAGLCAAGCGGVGTIAGSTSTSTSLAPSSSPTTTLGQHGPLKAPPVSAVDQGNYLREVTEVDAALATYAKQGGNVALKALLTDGSAFCAFLARGGGIDNAMVSLAIGAKGVEATTHLPSTVATFNAIEATALLTLCPSEQDLIPAADRKNVRALGRTLGE